MSGFFGRVLLYVKGGFIAVWVMSVMDITAEITAAGFDGAAMMSGWENVAKTATAIAGFIWFLKNLYDYFFIELPHKKQKNDLEIKTMRQDLDYKISKNPEIDKKKRLTDFYGFRVIQAIFVWIVILIWI
tara:strand:+ start:20096 stop:20485 length:390 start_codon:yes stop_codon:yes gene_type:complete